MIAFERTKAPPPLTPISQTVILSEGALAPQSKDPDTAHVAHADGTFLPAPCLLDGQPVPFINPDLTTGSNTASAKRLKENEGLCFIGPSPHGRFDVNSSCARKMLSAPLNVNGRPNSDVVRPVANAIDLVRAFRNVWTVDFGSSMTVEDAAKYEMPFEFVRNAVYAKRMENHREGYREKWWLYGEPRPGMRSALTPLARFVTSPRVSKHRIFVWRMPEVLCNDAAVIIAREDDYFFGVVQCTIHEVWALNMGTQLREAESGFRYTPDSTFDTFPFPWPPGTEPSEAESPIVKTIADAARSLVSLRDNWLNPKPAPGEPPIPESDLKKRTLTNLYNQRPAWLENAHRTLDEAVFAAYGWPVGLDGQALTTQQILANLLALNHQRAVAQTKPARSSKK